MVGEKTICVAFYWLKILINYNNRYICYKYQQTAIKEKRDGNLRIVYTNTSMSNSDLLEGWFDAAKSDVVKFQAHTQFLSSGGGGDVKWCRHLVSNCSIWGKLVNFNKTFSPLKSVLDITDSLLWRLIKGFFMETSCIKLHLHSLWS